MTIKAKLYQDDGSAQSIDWTADADYAAGDVIQLCDGRAGVVSVDVVSGDVVGVYVSGLFEVLKTLTMVVLPSSKLFWDHSAGKAHLLHRNDRDFFLGAAIADAASAAATVLVNLNVQPVYTVDLASGYASIPVSTAGWPHVYGGGNSVGFKFDLAAEAQKLDALSIRGAAPGCEGIFHALVCINLNGDDAAFDLNVGLANGTHASDADQITESIFAHIDGASLNINLESDDGTTEVAATDTTVDAVVGTPFLVQFDLRNLADIQAYIDGVNVLPASVFKLDAAAGPLKVLAHMEKSANDSPGNVTVLYAGLATAQV